MAKNTGRDKVWATALRMAREQRDETWRSYRTLGAGDVEVELEDGPSNRTIRDVLATMAEEGFLERVTENGLYEWRAPVEWSVPGDFSGESNDVSRYLERTLLERTDVDVEAADLYFAAKVAGPELEAAEDMIHRELPHSMEEEQRLRTQRVTDETGPEYLLVEVLNPEDDGYQETPYYTAEGEYVDGREATA